METNLSILLHLDKIQAPGEYDTDQIGTIISQNQQQIDTILADPTLTQSIVDTYSNDVGLIAITNIEGTS